MATMETPAAQSQQLSSPAFAIEPSRRHLYRRPGIEVLASNNPACLYDGGFEPYPSGKVISIVSNSDFEALFDPAIHPHIMTYLAEPPFSTASWELHVFRMGFDDDNPRNNPIVIFVVVDSDKLTTDIACGLVNRIASAVSAAHWKGESIYVDVVKKLHQGDTDWRSGW